MKLHRPLIQAVTAALTDIFVNIKQADDTVKTLLYINKKWGSRDRRWVAEIIYDIVRWWRLYCHIGGYDYMHPENVKWEDIIAIALLQKKLVPENPELLPAYHELEKHGKQDPVKRLPPVVKTSYPDWLYEKGKKELGKKWAETAAALNDPADVFLRCNTLKASREEILQQFKNAGIEAQPDDRSPDAIQLLQRVNLQAHPLYVSGYFEIQDIASQKVAYHCNPGEKDLIADVCAGAGGKALHIATLAGKQATILAADISPGRIKILEQRAWRAGIKNIQTIPIEGLSVYIGQCDIVLLDVPCSGTGVIRRHPDTKWKLSPELLQGYIQLQQDLLQKHHSLVKPGGSMIYATCSILPSEGEDQVKWFLNDHQGYSLKEEIRYWPQDGYDGFYVAELIRN